MADLGSPTALEDAARDSRAKLEAYQKSKAQAKSKDEIKLEGELGGIVGFIKGLMAIVGDAIVTGEHAATSQAVKNLMQGGVDLIGDLEHYWNTTAKPGKWNLSDAEEDFGAGFVKAFLETSMGVDLDKEPSEADPHIDIDSIGSETSTFRIKIDNKPAVKTIKRVVGFCLAVPFGVTALIGAGKMLLADRFPDSVAETLGGASEHLGLNFFLGTLFEQIFESAVGRPLEEIIAKQTHPARIDPMMARTLARQHKIDVGTFWQLLDNLGYPDSIKRVYLALDTQQLPTSELAVAYANGTLAKEDVEKYLKGLGYSKQDRDIVLANYIDKSETPGKVLYRSAARAAFLHHHLTDEQFTAILTKLDMPASEITLEIAAVKLEQTTAQKHFSMAQVKEMYRRGISDTATATQGIVDQGYSQDQAAQLVSTWDKEKTGVGKHLTAGKILSFRSANILTYPDAYNRLLSLGYNPNDAQLMAENPSTKKTGHDIPPTTGGIISALRHEVIPEQTAISLLQEIGLSPLAAALAIETAKREPTPHLTGVPSSVSLSKADIGAGVKYGVLDPYEAIDMLEAMGFSTADATVLVRIALKGGDLPPTSGHTAGGPTGLGFGLGPNVGPAPPLIRPPVPVPNG